MAGRTNGLPSYIPLDVLFGNPSRSNPQISPDGTRLAYLAPVDGVLNVWLGDVGADNSKPITKDSSRDIRTYFFAYDNEHLAYLQDKNGDENWRLYDINLVTGEERDLTPFEGVQVQILARLRETPNRILLGINKENPQIHDGYELDFATGNLEKTFANPGFLVMQAFGSLVPDSELRIRCVTRVKSDGGLEILVRESVDAQWETIIDLDLEDSMFAQVIRFTKNGEGLFLLSAEGAESTRFVRFDLNSRKTEVLAEDPNYDISNYYLPIAFDPNTWEPQLAAVLKDRFEYIVMDPSIEADVKSIQQLHEGDFVLVGRSDDDRTWLVTFIIDNASAVSFVYDRVAQQGRRLFEHQPELKKYTLAKMEPFSYKARDGLTIHGYLTFPVGLPRKDLPTVLLPHGGPWDRDIWRLHPWVQWAANRGYLVVQPNFRGSALYGKAHLNAGNLEWGGRMQDDLTDAVGHIVSQGYADPKRIAIMGGSYGGYATLAGAAFTPELFACAIDLVGPSNLITLLKSIPPYWEPIRAIWHKRMGEDPDFLWSRSPLSRVREIKIPLLIAHGANDPRVAQAESEQIVAALRDKGIDHEYLLFEDEGHGFVKPENNIKFFSAAEEFLAKHLGGRA